MEILLIQRTFTVSVTEIGVFAVNGIVAAEEDFFRSGGMNESNRTVDGHPCGIAVKIGEF